MARSLITVTPPSAVVRSRTPPKSIIITWSIWMPVSACTVWTTSDGPPASDALIFAVPLPGMVTQESRGMDRTSIRLRSGLNRTSMIASARWPATPSVASVPTLRSDPSSNTVIGRPAVVAGAGGSAATGTVWTDRVTELVTFHSSPAAPKISSASRPRLTCTAIQPHRRRRRAAVSSWVDSSRSSTPTRSPLTRSISVITAERRSRPLLVNQLTHCPLPKQSRWPICPYQTVKSTPASNRL